MKTGIDVRNNSRWARKLWAGITPVALVALRQLSERYKFPVPLGDVLLLSGR